MDSGISTVRNLLYIVLVLAILSIFANVYLGMQLSKNSDELVGFGLLLDEQMKKNVVGQSEQLQLKMDQIHLDMAGMDAKMQKSEDEFLKTKLPNAMDSYFRTRMPMIERQAMKQIPH